MGMYDNIKIHGNWLPDVPDWLVDAYGGMPGDIKFQTKDLDNCLLDYFVDIGGQLWVADTEAVEEPGSFSGFHIKETGTVSLVPFSGCIRAYSSLWGSGKPGTGTIPSLIYKSLGDYEILLYVENGTAFKSKVVNSEAPMKHSKAE